MGFDLLDIQTLINRAKRGDITALKPLADAAERLYRGDALLLQDRAYVTQRLSMFRLSPRQIEVACLVAKCMGESGMPPTLQEIADELDVSKVTAYEHVKALVHRQVLNQRPNIARNIRFCPGVLFGTPNPIRGMGSMPI